MERKLFEKILLGLKGGRLTLAENGRVSTYGDDSPDALEAMIEVHSPEFYRAAVFGGEIGMGESYMDGHWSSPDLPSLVRLAVRNLRVIDGANPLFSFVARTLARLDHLRKSNTVEGSRKNIQAHYDLSNDFFRLFLDSSMMYSSALWERENESLEQAQWNKLERICRVLRLCPEDHVLEIGTGWGGFALHAAKRFGCRITTTTISREQFSLAVQRVKEAGLEDRITVLLEDYRHLKGRYTKGVSIEMFEAVGLNHYDEFFATWERLLEPGASVLMQTITMNEKQFPGYQKSPDWIQKYIFPGGELSSVVEIQKSLARTGSYQLMDLSDMGIHYAWTLREWRRRFQDRIESVRELGFDARFERMWDYYLGYCEGAFLERYIGVVQLLLVHSKASVGVHGEPLAKLGIARAGGMYSEG
ncbi:MAG: cyclopropane-fatty-acyl-phospholipid synthase [Acidobacteria bacterium]|nr:cyclopropane-fatty-acyl-phospholipid synthase [Acidobacteriota bacterium]